MRLLVILAVACLLAAGGFHPARAATVIDEPLTTVVLVRHADKDTNFAGADQPLSTAGMLRAKELARVLGDVPFSAVFTTPWLRNRKTAEPLARLQGDSLTVVNAVEATIAGIRRHRGETILVVGHSNTIPQILSKLLDRPDLDSLAVDYDDLFVLTLGQGRVSRLLRLHYGAPAGFVR